MTVTLESRHPCQLCGYQHRIIHVTGIRINKRSIVTKGGLVSVGERVCPECGTANDGASAVTRFRMWPEDEAKVNAYRRQKGWAS